MTSAAARKAWATRRRLGRKRGKSIARARVKRRVRHSSAARKAIATRRKGKRIKVHSPNIRMDGHAQTTYAPPKGWWDYMTKHPHGAGRVPLSPAAAGHLWHHMYNHQKRIEIIKEYG